MEIIIAAVLFVAIATAAFGFGAAVLTPASPMAARLRVLLGQRPPQEQKVQDRLEQVMEPLSRVLPRSGEKVASSALLLIRAGYREPAHLTIFLGARLLLAVAFGVAVLLVVGYSNTLVLIAAPFVGYMAPSYFVRRKVRMRQTSVRLALPDALDLAVVCVEAGLGLDQALQRIGHEIEHAHPELSQELQLVHLEMRAGIPRADALRNFANRTGVDDVRSLVAVLVQTDRFGTSIGQALRVHSDSLRTERRQRAEEAAAKTTIKMIPALVFFVFPAMFVVTMGPVVVSLFRGLLPVISGK